MQLIHPGDANNFKDAYNLFFAQSFLYLRIYIFCVELI